MTLTPDEYLDHLSADAARLVAAVRAAGYETPVPCCPGWDVRALIAHVGAAYDHKVACMRLGRRPVDGEWSTGPEPGGDLVDWYQAVLAGLVRELTERGPQAPSYTWYPPDQTVGFWYRRMALETLVHRVDAEFAAGAATPVADDIALDGVDEMVGTFLTGPWWDVEPVESASGRAVAIRSGGRTWRAVLDPKRVLVGGDDAPTDAAVTAAPYDALLWVWGREPAGAVTVAGDAGAVDELDRRLALLRD